MVPYLHATADLLALMLERVLPAVGRKSSLGEAAASHVDVESGTTTGSPLPIREARVGHREPGQAPAQFGRKRRA